METFGSPILEDVQLDDNGFLKSNGKQKVTWHNETIVDFKAKQAVDDQGNLVFETNARGKRVPVFDIDPRTGLPKKELYDRVVEMVRVETKGDPTIKDDIANEIDRQQHYRSYKYFREGKIPVGNPIESFEYIQPTVYTELHLLGVHTIQQAALMNDLECERLQTQSGYEIRDFAEQWVRINTPQGQAGKAARLEGEVARLRRIIEDKEAKEAKGIRANILQADASGEFETHVETIEVPREELAIGKPRVKRKV